MRVLQVNCVYKTGSTGKIVYDLHTAYQEHGVESFVCYGRGARVSEGNVYKTASEVVSKGYNLLSRFTGIQYGGAWGGTWQLIRRIKKIKPDIVHLHCINGFFVNIYGLLSFLKKQKIPTVLTLHAEFMYTGSCGHALECEQWKAPEGCKHCPQLKEATNSFFFDRTAEAWRRMKRAFDGYEKLKVVSVSPWLMHRAEESAIMRGMDHSCVLNGIDTEVFHYRDAQALKKELGLQKKRVVLYVTAAFNAFKGADYVMELSKRMPETVFVVVGNRNEICEHPANLIPIGRVEDQEKLAEYYSMADVTVLTSKKETFSMVCAESLCCGTPVVGFEAGAPETISLPEYSEFCEYGNLQALETAVREWASKPKNDNCWHRAFVAYSKQKMLRNYMTIYRELLQQDGGKS